ncbi:unnamed protein product [Closterium sp. Yama58-4]|nr:unnamed protein product [Closterium sp. Yama58-4]
MARGRYTEAIAIYNKLASTPSLKDRVLVGRGSCYGALGQFDKALADLSAALSINPTSKAGFMARAGTYFKMNKLVEAIVDYSRVIDLDPSDAEAVRWRGILSFNLKYYYAAEKDFQQAIQLDPSLPFVFKGLGLAIGGSGRWRESLAVFAEGVRRHSQDADLWHSKGRAHKEVGEDADLWHSKGRAHKEVGEVANAIEALERALQIRNFVFSLASFPLATFHHVFNPLSLRLSTGPPYAMQERGWSWTGETWNSFMPTPAACMLWETSTHFPSRLQPSLPLPIRAAIRYAREGLELDSGDMELVHAHASSLHALGDLAEAYQSALTLQPRDQEGQALQHSMFYQACFSSSISDPTDAVLWKDQLKNRFAQGFRSSTPIKVWDLQTVKYYPVFNKSFEAMREALLESEQAFTNNQPIAVPRNTRGDMVSGVRMSHETHMAICRVKCACLLKHTW